MKKSDDGKVFFPGRKGQVKPTGIYSSLQNGFSYGGYQGITKQPRNDGSGFIKAQLSNGVNISFNTAEWYSPELTPEMWLLPKSRQETLRWCRIAFALDPYIYQIILMHAKSPFSRFKLNTRDEKITDFYNQCTFNKKFNLLNYLQRCNLGKHKFGESIQMGILEDKNENDKASFSKWKNFVTFEPEMIEVKQAFYEDEPRFYALINGDMKKDIQEALQENRYGSDEDKENAKQMLKNDKMLLDSEYVSFIGELTDASAMRGTAPIACLQKVLMFQDKISGLKLTAIDRFREPIEIWTLGDLTANPPIKPTAEDLQNFEQFIKTAKSSKPYTLFVPPFAKYEVVGYGNEKTLFDYTQDYEWIRDSIMVALGVNKNLIMGEGPSMSNVKDLGLMKLYKMWSQDQDTWTEWMKYNFYEPLAEANQFKDDKGLILPDIEWDTNFRTDRDDTEDYENLWKDGIIDTTTRLSKYRSLDPATVQERLKKEIGSVWDDGERIRNREYAGKAEEKEKQDTEKIAEENVKEEGEQPTEVTPIEETTTEGPKPEEVKEIPVEKAE